MANSDKIIQQDGHAPVVPQCGHHWDTTEWRRKGFPQHSPGRPVLHRLSKLLSVVESHACLSHRSQLMDVVTSYSGWVLKECGFSSDCKEPLTSTATSLYFLCQNKADATCMQKLLTHLRRITAEELAVAFQCFKFALFWQDHLKDSQSPLSFPLPGHGEHLDCNNPGVSFSSPAWQSLLWS